jgi:hypothetical protein
MIQGSYLQQRDFQAGEAFSRKLAALLGDSTYIQTADQLDSLMGRIGDRSGDTTSAPLN